ncbi:MAG: hypothetical protein GWN01_06780, partial [Nitrosopumilaceae archaeon]|nr:glycosyltransferase family 4 protein [Nitrosopumilaceae archaeon]NIU88715.1 hypothetical protein [Nitrosopumilaceae archaeon]NIV65608.1 hypothetical protein [Nitrosopumilaceae archaeon]NIX61240.1 hypothetical protein [Nitrosopumilaceae archaeon]
LKQKSELRKELAENARKFAVEKFSLSAMIEAYEKLYLEEYHKKFSEK